MPPASDGKRPDKLYTVGCRLDKLLLEEAHLPLIQDAVHRVHKATILATELANLHLRRCLRDGLPYDGLFCKNWLAKVYQEVTTCADGTRAAGVDTALHETNAAHTPQFDPPSRTGLTQCIQYACTGLAATASNNVWMHFSKRVRSHVRRQLALDETAYSALSTQQKKDRRLLLLQLAHDILKMPHEPMKSAAEHQAWVAAERTTLGIDAAVGAWREKPLLWHLKAAPHRFVPAMSYMSSLCEQQGGKAFALFPLRRTYTPRHVHFCQHALRHLLALGTSEHTKQKAAATRRSKKQATEMGAACAIAAGGYDSDERDSASTSGPAGSKRKRARRAKADLVSEKAELLCRVVDLRKAGIRRRWQFDFAFSTDGVCARVQMQKPQKAAPAAPRASLPTRGYWAIDELKRVARLEQLHVVGVDPGKRELVVAVDMDDHTGCSSVRYTQQQRQFEMRSKQYRHEGTVDKPAAVQQSEAQLSAFRSRSADLDTFSAYCAKRHEQLEPTLAFYAHLGHRQRRWKTCIKTQQSEERLYQRLEGIQKKGDARTLVLAYGSWGLVAGRPEMACNKGIPPCIGVGLMRKLAKRFVVAITPEAWTSKTCCKCLGECGPWAEVEEKRGKKIRGLRLCQTEDCRLPINRDRNGATNIGTNFKRLFEGKGSIRSMNEEDLELHRLNLCFEST